ncbi:hypothetical protein [Seonamhaeicola maritimus]|uniref:Uncharacterized protein n=1 Tax=Seonamhaeicola maritimus TaxID=2591822 RepID=A0A5C7GMF3_9FLAO|nr:hypothetical protein [Seonamhaeicola maritimus]TXG39440.1 hypothetical protein FUA22_06090 [Seonamhaeicola maritimus]
MYFCSHAQIEYEYVGGIVLSDTSKTTYSYKISFKVVNELVSGYSITNMGTEYETKTTISGNYNKQKKELLIRETGIIYTKTPIKIDEESCFVNFSVKPFISEKTKSTSGSFEGMTVNFKKCAEGKIFLNSLEKVEDRMNKVAKKLNKIKRVPDSIKQKFQPLKMMDSMNMNILRKNQTLSIFTNDEKIKLIVYDGGKEDGDRISIMSNGKTIRKSYKATNKRNIILLNLDSIKTSIVIKAENEGQISPNTVVVELVDQENNIRALSNLKMGEETRIDVLKK